MATFDWTDLGDGVVLLTMDDPDQSAITMNDWFLGSLRDSVDALAAAPGVTGVVLTSAKRTFSAGGDLQLMRSATPADAPRVTAYVAGIKQQMRRLEQLGKPVVAALNGAALGGGYELALCCHHRIALPDAKVGLPEITLGLLPGGGGVTRLVRLLGLTKALDTVLLTGRAFRADEALAVGLVDALAPDREALVAAAKEWVLANPDAVQPWERPGWVMPGGAPSTAGPSMAGLLPTLPAALRARTRGAPASAQRNLLAAAVEGAQVDVDTALRIESEYCVELICGQESTNIISTMFYGVQGIARGGSRPAEPAPWVASRVLVLGAGMMGAGIAHACARAGLQVVLKDTSLEVAERGRAHTERLLAKRPAPGVLERITATADLADAAGCDLVIEAVFEDPDLKRALLAEAEGVVAPDALLASNTSTLPITELARGVGRPEDFLGLHFFSPVDKMPLVEIVVGEKTSDAALARGFDLVRRLGKTPILVNDSRGFFTSRVIIRFVLEAAAMVGEGIAPASIEQAALQAGYPTGPLALIDELALPLILRIRDETPTDEVHPGHAVLEALVAAGRTGRAGGAGFYGYDDGGRTGIWPGLSARYPGSGTTADLVELQERMLFAEALDAVRCLDEGVLRSVEDANVGSILGIGFPQWTGGVLQYVEQYGVDRFVARAEQLARRHGDRFLPPPSLLERAGQR